jgi:hypothetical protein
MSDEIEKQDFAPARWVNLFKILVYSNVSRIAFGDAVVGKDALFHTAVIMSTEDLKALALVINDTIAEMEKNKNV